MQMNLGYFFEELRQDSYLAEQDLHYNKDEIKSFDEWLQIFLDWRERESDSSLEPQYKIARLVSEVQIEE